MRYPVRLKQTQRLAILHIDMPKTAQQVQIRLPPRAEKQLRRTEYRRNTVCGNAFLLEQTQIGRPKLILHKDNLPRTYRLHKPFRIATSSKRKIQNKVGFVVVFAHLIPRRREESQKNLLLGLLSFQALYYRTSLLKLTHRSGMKPDTILIYIAALAEPPLRLTLTLHQQTRFAMAQKSGYVDKTEV